MAEGSNRPGYEDALEQIERTKAAAPALCEVRDLGKSVQGRSIRCAVLTDPAAPAENKQHVLIVAGQHGTEESGRAIALELMDFLISGEPEAAEILARQCIAIVPCANPDGAVAETSRNADGVDMAHTYALDAPAATPEGRAIEQFALEFVPDVVVDIHGRGGGGMKELAWLSPALVFSADRYFLSLMSLEMARVGEEAGFPQCEFHPPGPLQPREGNELMLGEKLAGEVKALCMGLETIEYYYREADWRKTGLVRLRRLLRFGMEDFFGLGEPGYPASLVSGNRICGLKAHGTTAAARRANRVELTAFLRRNWAIVDRAPDGLEKCARVKVYSETCEGPNPPRFSVLLRIKKPCEVQAVEWNGRQLDEGDEHGFRQWEDHCSRFVQVNIAEPFGGPERHLVVRYDSPLFAD